MLFGNGMKNKGIDVLNRVLILVFTGLFIWSLWPLSRETQILQPDQVYLEPELIESCSTISQLFNSQFELEYPEKIWKSETDEIILSINPQQNMNSDSTAQNIDCSLVLDTRLESNSLSIEPGDRIVIPFSNELSQTILFNITPHTVDTVEGELWINIDAYTEEENSPVRVPLFVIPLEFKVVSVLGVPPVLMRYICLFILLLQMLIAFRKRLFG